jgi:hypothetical protein
VSATYHDRRNAKEPSVLHLGDHMLAHELRGRELADGELRRVAERTWQKFLWHGWPIHGPKHAA